MRIGELAKRAGVSSSAIRYYERVGLIAPPPRVSGRRSYPADALARLAVVRHARALGFSIAETGRLLATFPRAAPAERWKALAEVKLRALDTMIAHAQATRRMLEAISNCRCDGWEECGTALLPRLQG
jgi:MerR family redox-sensitive transcriptional activator SoxR